MKSKYDFPPGCDDFLLANYKELGPTQIGKMWGIPADAVRSRARSLDAQQKRGPRLRRRETREIPDDIKGKLGFFDTPYSDCRWERL